MAITGAWVYGTGNSLTLPTYRYNGPFTDLEGVGEKNSFRMAPYHRLDLNISLESKKNQFRKWQGSWNFGVYNLYNRANPYFVSTGRDNDTGQRVFRQFSLFPIIPSVSYQFKF